MAPVPGSPWKCVSRMTSLPPSPHTKAVAARLARGKGRERTYGTRSSRTIVQAASRCNATVCGSNTCPRPCSCQAEATLCAVVPVVLVVVGALQAWTPPAANKTIPRRGDTRPPAGEATRSITVVDIEGCTVRVGCAVPAGDHIDRAGLARGQIQTVGCGVDTIAAVIAVSGSA